MDLPATKLDAAWLHEGPLAKLLAALNTNGDEARAVGGAVRNALLGEPVHEVDVATTADPKTVISRVNKAGFKAVPTGIEHGTVTVVVGHHPFEVTTLREDVETFGRHATVRFGRDWKKDAERRDFTMNAFSAGADGSVYDYVGGIADLKARKVRFIGDPATRIAEDYLRILRFFRFHARYGHGFLDAAGLHACIAGRAGLDQLSRERVRMELMKLLVAPHATPVLATMSEAGILVRVLGGVPLLASFENMAKVEAAIGAPADPVQRLGALGVWLPEDAERLFERLRLSNVEHERLTSMGDAWWRIAPSGEKTARAQLYRIGPQGFIDRVLLAWARTWEGGAADRTWKSFAELPQRWTAPVFPLKSADFIERGIQKGPALGIAMRAAEAVWIAADFPMDVGTIQQIADDAAR